jgi:hypothetical protein
MRLDCETERGRVFIGHQIKTQNILESLGYKIISMSTKDSKSDVIIARDIDGVTTMTGVAEIKSREMAGSVPLTRSYLSRNGGYLITEDKIHHGKKLSSITNVPFFVIVNLLKENVILIWKVTNSSGDLIIDYKSKATVTQATCNGGKANRVNAFLPIENAYCFEY